MTIHTPAVHADRDGLAILGRTLHDLRGIRLGEGEGGNSAATTTDAGAAAAAGAASTDASAASGAASTTDAAAGSQAAGVAPEKVEDLPAWAQKIIHDTRTEAATHRTKAQSAATEAQAALSEKIAVALGLKPDAAQDPAALTASLTAAQQSAKEASLKLAVYQAAGTAGGNPDALLDSNTFLASVRELDSTSSDFSTKVTDAIKAAVAANPTLKQARAAGASTVETPGGTGEQGQITEAQLAQMTPEQIAAAYEKGLLKGLL